MFKKIAAPFLIFSFLLTGSFGFFDAKKAEAAPHILFSSPVNYTVQNNPWGLFISDIDGDTHLDAALTNSGSASASVIFGAGDGTFGASTDYTVGSSPRAVTLADVNNDTFDDMIVSNRTGNSINIFPGNGDGTFDAALSPAITCTDSPGCIPRYTAFGYLDGDANLDLVIAASGNSAPTSIVVQLGNGDGTFGTSVPYAAGLVNVFVALYDFDGDNELDIISANETGDNISVLLGVGDGTFGATTDYATGDGPNAIAIADFNHDNEADIAVSATNTAGVLVRLGVGDGTFGAATSYATGSGAVEVDAADFDLDGEMDLVVVNRTASNVSILLGRGNGTFDAATNFSTGSLPFNVRTGDFDENGYMDLMTTNGGSSNVSVLLNDNDTKVITDFTFGLSGEIDNIVGTDIDIEVPYDTDVSSLTPTITFTASDVSPNTGVSNDFTSPAIYTVTAINDTTQDYTVTVTLAPPPSVNILSISPDNGDTRSMATPVVVTTDIDTSCTYDLDSAGATSFADTGGKIHTDNLLGVTPGSP